METLYTQNHFSSPLSPNTHCKNNELLMDNYPNPIGIRSAKSIERNCTRIVEASVTLSTPVRKGVGRSDQTAELPAKQGRLDQVGERMVAVPIEAPVSLSAPLIKELTQSELKAEKQEKLDQVLPKQEAHVPVVVPRNSSPAVFEPEVLSGEDELDSREREYFMRCVILGTKGTGKHSLVDSNFPSAGKTEYRGKSDFIKRETVRFNTTRKYHFWLKTVRDETITEETIWKAYYQWATAFVFVYDTTSKESFEALEEAVKKVLKVVPQDKFFGILVGTKSDLHKQAAVNYEDAMEFKVKYNFSHFFETSCLNEKETPQLLYRLNPKLKLVFEAI